MNRKSIEEMIMSGASWVDIKSRIDEIQAEKEKKDAEMKAKAETRAQCEKKKANFVAAFVDWLIAEGVITEAEKEQFTQLVNKESSQLIQEAKNLSSVIRLINRR